MIRAFFRQGHLPTTSRTTRFASDSPTPIQIIRGFENEIIFIFKDDTQDPWLTLGNDSKAIIQRIDNKARVLDKSLTYFEDDKAKLII